VKGLDTPILLGILNGSPSVRPLLRSLSGEELATTELNMIELSAIAGHGGVRGRKERLQALERLRRRMTVLPIDRRVTELLSQRAPETRTAADLHLNMIMAAFEAAGCSHVLTDSRTPTSHAPWKVKVTSITIK
jgi:predicted nucleic acid-binding protein